MIAGRYNKWLVVALLWIVGCLNYMDRMTVFAIFPVLQREMHLSNVDLAMLGSVFLWVYGLCSPAAGYFGDRFHRKTIILVSLGIFSIVTAATGLGHNEFQLVSLRVLLGVSEALFLPAALAHIASFHTNATRSLANALVLTGLPAGAGLGGFYSGYMAEHYSWRVGFYLLGAFGLLLLFVLWAALPDKVTPFSIEHAVSHAYVGSGESLLKKTRGVFRNPTSVGLIYLALALSITSWPISSWMPTYFHERFSMSLTRAGFVLAVFTYLPALIGAIAGGLWADRWAEGNVKARIWVQAAALCIMAPAALAIGYISTGRTLTVDLFLYSIWRGSLEVNSMPVFTSVLPSNRWATAYGLYNMVGTIAGSLGVLFVGTMKSRWGIGPALSLLSLFLFTAILVLALVPFRVSDARALENRLREEDAEIGSVRS